MTTDRVSDEKLREILAAFYPAECAPNCNDPFCPYNHTADYGEFSVAEYRMASELLALREAAQKVYAGLNVRINAAPADAVPLFDGIAELHDAINFGVSDV